MKILDITENEDGSCDVEFELTKDETKMLVGNVVEQALINYAIKENGMNDEWQDRASYEAELARCHEVISMFLQDYDFGGWSDVTIEKAREVLPKQ